MGTLERYMGAVKYKVCSTCIDSDGRGACRLNGEKPCALTLYFPKTIETILSVQSNKLEEYVRALRSNVCAACKHQSPNGTCLIRQHIDCGLDRYFPMIIEIVEDVRVELESEKEGFDDEP